MSSPLGLDDDHVYPLSPRDIRRRVMLILFGVFVAAFVVLIVVDSTRPSPRWSKLGGRCPSLPATFAAGTGGEPVPGSRFLGSHDPNQYSCLWLLGTGIGLQADVARYEGGLVKNSDEVARQAVADEYFTGFRAVGPQTAQARFGDLGTDDHHRWLLMTAVDNVTITVQFTPTDVARPWSATQGRTMEQTIADAMVKALG